MPVPPRQVARDFPPHALIVGPGSLRQLHPSRLQAWLFHGRRSLAFCGASWHPQDVQRHGALMLGRCIEPTHLEAWLEDVVRRHEQGLVRRHVDPGAWLVRSPAGRHADFALRAAAELAALVPLYDMDGLAQRLGVSLTTLGRRLREALDMSPSDMSLAYLSEYWRVARAAGDSAETITAALGYADPSALAHALARARARHAGPDGR